MMMTMKTLTSILPPPLLLLVRLPIFVVHQIDDGVNHHQRHHHHHHDTGTWNIIFRVGEWTPSPLFRRPPPLLLPPPPPHTTITNQMMTMTTTTALSTRIPVAVTHVVVYCGWKNRRRRRPLRHLPLWN